MIDKRGFSLIELLITIGLTVSISVISIPLYSNLQSSTKLDESVAQIVDFLRSSRELSRAGYRNASHGVYFDPGGNKIVAYQGVSYEIRDPIYDQVLNLEPGVTVAITIPGNEVNYTAGAGMPDATGQIELSFEAKKRLININQYGIPLDISTR